MYIIRNFTKHSEQDVFETGCIPNTGELTSFDITFSHETKEGLVKAVEEYFDVNPDNIQLNSCEEPGRIDIARLETDQSIPANSFEIGRWKKGKLRLWHTIYSGTLEQIEPASF